MDLAELKKYNRIHLIGIGGISMSAIAETLHNWGFTVTGSDISQSQITDTLVEHGIEVTIGHDLVNSKKADLIIFSAAISDTDPEILIANENHIRLVGRGEFVGYLTKMYNETICISGTHGKTTTTSLLSICFINDHKDPSIEVGAILNQIGGNYRVGNSDYFILESCEYKENFLKFFPNTAIVLNIDNDHLDYYKNLENIIKAFKKFASIVDPSGLLVVNADDKNCLDLKNDTKAKFLSYGIDNQDANFVAKNISFDKEGYPSFDVYKNGELYDSYSLSITGRHNVLNALACITVCDYYNLNKNVVKESLGSFTGAGRRLEYKGTINDNVKIYDDYAHHPTEIAAVANAVKNKTYNQSWVVFQPHTYSRTKELLSDFAKAISNFDNVILVDIYAAREKNTFNISSEDLKNEIIKNGHQAEYIPNFNDVVSYLKNNVSPNDIIITLGAGTVKDIGQRLL